MSNTTTFVLGLTGGFAALVAIAGLFADASKVPLEKEGTGNYVRFHNVIVPPARMGGDGYLVSGGAHCAPSKAPKDCVDEVVQDISSTMNAQASRQFTDVIPNIVGIREGNVRSFTELKSMSSGYTIDSVYQGKGSLQVIPAYYRAKCPNAFVGGCPTGREF